jgi:hypothetical protein
MRTWNQNKSSGFRSPLEVVLQRSQLVHYLAGRCVWSRFRGSPTCQDVRGDTDKTARIFDMEEGQRQKQDDHIPHWLAHEAPKHVPLLLVADCSAPDCDRIRGDELPESRKRCVLWVDGEGEAEITCGVFVPDVGDGRVWERGETFKRGVHLCACTLKEDTTTCDEERVAREDRTDGRRCIRGGVGHVVADRILCVAGRCETPVEPAGVAEVSKCK